MSVRNIGAFFGGAAQGLENGAKVGAVWQNTQLKREADQRDADKWKEMAEYLNDAYNGTGRFAVDQPTSAVAPVSSNMAQMAPDAAGPPADMGGGSAQTLMQRSLAQQQPASGYAQSMVQPQPQQPMIVPPRMARTPRRLPFLDFVGG